MSVRSKRRERRWHVHRCPPSLPGGSCSMQALLFQVQLPLDQAQRLIINAALVA